MNHGSEGELIFLNPTRSIWWEGRRYLGEVKKFLIPFGCFVDSLTESPIDAEQELDTAAAEVICDTRYPSGRVQTTAFVHYTDDMIILRKTLIPENGRLDYTFTYAFCENGDINAPTALTEMTASVCADGGVIAYSLTDRVGRHGVIRIGCDGQIPCVADGHKLSFHVVADTPRTLTFVLCFADNMELDDPAAEAEAQIKATLAAGFDALRAEHSRAWAAYYAEGYAVTGEPGIDRVYMTAQYHVRSFATRYSLPVGLNDTTWGGKFFGFDEHYMAMGLLTSGHLPIARRVPEFRKKGLEIAVHRASSRHHNSARYPWETLEDGNEASPPGFYFDHIFHMAAIPLSGWMYYIYSGDLDFLRETVYPVMDACAEFFRLQMLYRVEGGRLIVGKCTDLERMGSAVENAYMTTCGVIATFRAFAEASRRLGCNAELAETYVTLAEELFAALPTDGEKFLPYPGCTDRSIAAFSGTHPFDVIERDDPRQLRAIADYLAYEDTFGNMYAVGSGVCSWYACWKGVVFSRLERAEEATDALRYVVNTAGDFGDLFEINNAASKTYMHPWFTTAAGMFCHAVNESLLQSDEEGNLYFFRGLSDDHKNVKFRLAAKGGLSVGFEMVDGEIRTLAVYGNRFCRFREVVAHLPASLGGDRIIAVTAAEEV
ncbi:MAG: hypothetical protein IKM11_05765 [Oscillospiraceae bacterium]|nr:hypothetical protein [Oscillospiraceae bacterium]